MERSASPVAASPLDADIAALFPAMQLPDELTVDAFRARLVAAAEARKAYPDPGCVKVGEDWIEEGSHRLRIRTYRTHDRPAPVLLYFHGGGWIGGDIETNDRVAKILSHRTEAVVVSVAYRRPPEWPYPAAVEDALVALRHILANVEHYGGVGVALSGDSAGGNIAAAAALQAAREGLPLLAQLLLYPATDLTGRYADPAVNALYPSRASNGAGFYLTLSSLAWFAGHYVPEPDRAAEPGASPVRAPDLTAMPPTLIATAEYDPLRDEGDKLGDALRDAGVEVRHHKGRGLIHGYFGLEHVSSGAADEIVRVCSDFAFILRQRVKAHG